MIKLDNYYLGDYKLSDFTYSRTAIDNQLDNSLPEEFIDNAQLTLLALTIINKRTGHYHTITSGYRCDSVNVLVGGVINSLHRSALAVDFIPHKSECHSLFEREFKNLVSAFLKTICIDTQYSIDVIFYPKKNIFHLELQPIS